MECLYPPFNWTQKNSNDAIPITDTKEYVSGYDVYIAKYIADYLDMDLEIYKIKWEGLIPSLEGNMIDVIIAGMSPTKERRKSIDFSDGYYLSDTCIVIKKDSIYKNAKSINDFENAKITSQQGTLPYTVIDQMKNVNKQEAMTDFSAMRVAVISGIIDGYVAERSEAISASKKISDLTYIDLKNNENGFKIDPTIGMAAIGIKKGNTTLLNKINEALSKLPEEKRNELMNKAIDSQLINDTEDNSDNSSFINKTIDIFNKYKGMFLRGTLVTIFLSLSGTIIGLIIGLLTGVIRTIPPKEKDGKLPLYLKLINNIISIYIEIFRGTPMIVQSMVFYYGFAIITGIQIDKFLAAIIIVAINTGAYMSEVVRGGIKSIDVGQFEAAKSLGMTHFQTMKHIILPQTIRNILPATGNEFIINLKDTSVLNVISVNELFYQSNSIASTNYSFFETFSITALIYFTLTFIITRILRFIEQKLDGPSNYKKIDVDFVKSGQDQINN